MKVTRTTGRALVVDGEGYVLLFRGHDPARPEAGSWWLTPGGGTADGESPADAARRELREETGLVVADLGPVVFERTWEFDFDGVAYRQAEHYFCVRTERFMPDTSAWTGVERRSMFEHRWWSAVELATTDETVYPEALAALLRELLAQSGTK